jgi:hypothetical protein
MDIRVDVYSLAEIACSCLYFYILDIGSNLIDRHTSVSKVSLLHRRASAVTFCLCMYIYIYIYINVSREQMIL